MAATRGNPIRYNNDYTSTKSAVDAALTKVGATYSWSSTVTAAGQIARAEQVTDLKNAVDAAWARYCAHTFTCGNRATCTNNSPHTFTCSNRTYCNNNSHTISCGNRSSCTNHSNRSNYTNNGGDGSSNSSNNGNNGSVWSSFCYSVYRSSKKCGGEIDWRTLGRILSQAGEV